MKSKNISSMLSYAGTCKVIYCQSRKAFYQANWQYDHWEWSEVSEADCISLIKNGWTAIAVPNIGEVLE